MSPNAACLYMRDGGLPNAKLFCNSALGDAACQKAAYLADIFFCQPRCKLSGVDVCSMPDFVSVVLGRGRPSKIVCGAVGGVAIPMGNFMVRSGFRPMKCKAHQLVNQLGSLGASTHRKFDGWVSSGLVSPRSKDARNLSLIGTYTAMAADLIIGVLRNGAPSFFHQPVLTQARS